MSDAEISEARRLLDQLGYWVSLEATGIAIHGNPSVPPYPASHGCIRIPMFAAKEFSAIAKIGMVVIVYDINPLTETERRRPSSVNRKSADLQRN